MLGPTEALPDGLLMRVVVRFIRTVVDCASIEGVAAVTFLERGRVAEATNP